MKSRFNHEEQKGYAIFFKDVCAKCPLKPHCPTQKYGKHNYKWEYDEVKLRLRDRRLYERTPEFHAEYRLRNGIEALNGNLKQNSPLRRLRGRGRAAVHTAIYMIAAMHNLMQYVRYCRKTGKNFTAGVMATVFCPLTTGLAVLFDFFHRLTMRFNVFAVWTRPFPSC